MVKYRIYVIYVVIGLDSNVYMRRQAIIKTNGDSLLNRHIVSSSQLAYEPLGSSHRNCQSN